MYVHHDASKTTFGVPKNEEEKEKWYNSFGNGLKKSHRVCTKHFETNEIKNNRESGEG